MLDMTMPGMDGRECFEELKKINPDVKAVVATGHALDGAAQETIDAGALRFIHKPFIMAELAETLAKALARYGQVAWHMGGRAQSTWES